VTIKFERGACGVPVATLFEKGAPAYFEEESDRDGDLWLFLHIPKTAGSSFRAELASALKPNDNIVVNYRDETIPFGAQRDAVVSDFIERHRQSPRRFVSGHLRMRHVARIKEAHPATKIVVMLRDPIKRIVSDYRYQMTDVHPLHESFQKKFPTIEHYLDDEVSHNKMFSFMALPGEDAAAVVARIERTFAFVGLVETYPVSFRTMFHLLGKERRPKVHTRKTTETAENKVELDGRLAGSLKAANSLDLAIYRHFRQRLADAKGGLWSHLGGNAKRLSEPRTAI
jgi:hypothetical protein